MPHVQFGELPSYVAYMLGFSYEDRSMYFVDTSGAKIASKVTVTLCFVQWHSSIVIARTG